jgi:biotin synthase
MVQESPEWVKVSYAAAITLGLEPGLFYRGARLTCINLLMQYGDGCKANCLYCGQAREIPGGSQCKNLIRVEWPSYRLNEVIERTKQIQDCVERVCISMITHPRASEDLIKIVGNIYSEIDLPISTLITPTLVTRECMRRIKEAGAEMVGVAIDAATPNLFHMLRGWSAKSPHRWDRYVNGLKEAVEVFGEGRVGCHLIVGLGESEKEMVSTIQMVHDLGAETHLFSFFPERGSALENKPQPPIGQYRRVQLARYLIDKEISKFCLMKFDNMGRLTEFGVEDANLMEIVETGRPFETSGCPGCNRPFANERPSQLIRNFPFPLTEEDVAIVKKQIWTYEPPLSQALPNDS